MVKESVAALVAVVFALGATSTASATGAQTPAPKAEEKKPADKMQKKAEKKPAAKKEAKGDKAPAATTDKAADAKK
ncbi:MAG TPA: hypothetical protein VIE36_15810 [Methylomirabilota bacterium]|jgi:hypothetical protein